MPTLLKVARWSELYENNRTRDMKTMQWVPVPNKHDGVGYAMLMDHPNGAAHLGAWLAILQVASKCTPRGVLARGNGKPHDSTSLFIISKIPKKVFDEAIPRLLSSDIGWLESMSNEISLPQEGAEIPQAGAEIPQEGAGNGMEENGMEEKRKPGTSAPGESVSDSEPDQEKSDPLAKFPILADAYPDFCAGILQRHGAAYLPTTDPEIRKWRQTLAQCVTCEKLTEQEIADALRWCLFEEEGGHAGDFAWWVQVRSLGALRSKGKGSGVSKIKMVVKAWKQHQEHSETWRTQVNSGWTRPTVETTTTDGSKLDRATSRTASSGKPNAIADAMENLPY